MKINVHTTNTKCTDNKIKKMTTDIKNKENAYGK